MTTQASSKTFILVPSMPTPNGRLHLGHIAGPFLRLDVAARYLRSRGHKALLICGTDPYESYVTHHAESEGTNSHKLARKYTFGIQNDLATYGIDFDIWLDPLLYPGREAFERHCQDLLQRLIKLNVANYQTRMMPYAVNRQHFIPRSFIAGKCPSCEDGIVGCICESCGRQFMAEEIIEPYFRPSKAPLPADELQWRKVEVLELSLTENDPRIKNLVADVKSLDIPSRQANIVLNHIRDHNCEVELTVPGQYGIPWQDKTDPSQIIFSYSTVYPFFLAIGEIFALAMGSDKNAFAIDSDVVKISSYGADITIPWISVPTLMCHLDVNEDGQQQYTGYDYYWGNEFLCLHGGKFSTSRRHVIWASEFIEQTPVNVDMARYYLSTIDPAEQQTNFLIGDLLSTINNVVIDEIYHTVDVCIQQYHPHVVHSASVNMTTLLDKVFKQQDSCFDSSQFHLTKATTVISDWVKTWQQLKYKNQSDSYWFLKSLAIISYPIMPDFAEKLWQHLGASGIPNIEQFEKKTMVRTTTFQTKVKHINHADISPCLPDTLNHLVNDPTEEPYHV